MALNSKFKIPNGLELLKSLKNARAAWKLKTPMQKWCYFYALGKEAFRIIRVPLLNDVHHVHWFAFAVVVYFNIAISLSIYTVALYAYQGDIQKGLPSTCMALLSIGVCKIKFCLMFQFEIVSL